MYKTFDIYDDFRNIEEIENYWRDVGFPIRYKNEYNHIRELEKIINYDDSQILYDGNKLKQTMHGCGFLWTYFPHWVDVEVGTTGSVIENWCNPTKFKELILKTYKYELKHNSSKRFTVNRIRQNAKVYCAKQSVSNFRPTVAKYIYNTYGNKGVVWDMSCGWGGRLLGFLSSDCKKYIGTEPSTNTYNGLLEMSKDYSYVGKDIEIYKKGSESFVPTDEVDLCFTSPPYFNTEKYSCEYSQSYIKYPTKEEWVDGFLKNTIINCKNALKKNGYLIINIANVKSFINLEEVTVNTAKRVGFELVDTLRLVLSSVNGKGEKYEPVFIFKVVK